jgi:hypothetical protein
MDEFYSKQTGIPYLQVVLPQIKNHRHPEQRIPTKRRSYFSRQNVPSRTLESGECPQGLWEEVAEEVKMGLTKRMIQNFKPASHLQGPEPKVEDVEKSSQEEPIVETFSPSNMRPSITHSMPGHIPVNDATKSSPFQGCLDSIFEDTKRSCFLRRPADETPAQRNMTPHPEPSKVSEGSDDRFSAIKILQDCPDEDEFTGDSDSNTEGSEGSIKRFPNFHINLKRLSTPKSLSIGSRRHGNGPKQTLHILIALLDIEGPTLVRVKNGSNVGKRMQLLKLTIGGNGIAGHVAVWGEIAELWDKKLKVFDVVHLEGKSFIGISIKPVFKICRHQHDLDLRRIFFFHSIGASFLEGHSLLPYCSYRR